MEKTREDQVTGELHSRMNEFHDKFLSPQMEIVSSDPGKFLAWLVLVSTMLTLLLGHIVYLSVFFLLYVTWAYTDHLDKDSGSKDVSKDSEENEWLLDKFICFLQNLDNESFDLDVAAIPSEQDLIVKAEFESEKSETTCSVVSDDSDSSAMTLDDEEMRDVSDSEDTSEESDNDSGSGCEDSETDFELDDFEIISEQDL